MSYACEVWGACQAQPLETLHLKFFKQVLGVRQTTPNAFVYGELGVYPLSIDRKVRILKYWLKLVTSPTDSLTYRVYAELKKNIPNCTTNHNWAKTAKNLLESNGFGYIWLQQGIHDSENVFIAKFKQRLVDQYQQNWSDAVTQTSQHRIYKQFKTRFQFEPYLENIENNKLRKSLTKIRVGSHNFLVERGRWATPKLEFHERLCTLCQSVEDEYHVFIECPRFETERKTLPNDIRQKPSMYKFITLLKSCSFDQMKKLAVVSNRIITQYEQFM